ncbi:hypothetical protein [Bradyrhizobium sp. CCBAU 11434]|uniref:hypothetical protein n=1 Tax=Bradyrhizobium sp. CCBAU 11434 TaxID=1630885 RepID=UPI0023050E29|nr:hypothetical protein [Bradyrhizobium sp. CCBAU 11434]
MRGYNEQACYGRGAVGLGFNSVHSAPLPGATAHDVGVSPERLAKLDEFSAHEIASKRVPGAVVAVVSDDKLIHDEGAQATRSCKRKVDAASRDVVIQELERRQKLLMGELVHRIKKTSRS